MSTFSVGGLASGLDTKTIVDQLMGIESRGRMKLEWKQQLWTARKTAWSDLNSRLLTLQNAAKALLEPATWTPPPAAGGTTTPGTWGATSADPSRLSATIASGATPTAGTYAVDVLQLASGETSRSSGALAPPTAGTRATGAFYEGNNNIVEGNEALTSLRRQDGTSLGVNTNSRITMSWTANGVTQSAQFRVNTVANGGNGTNLTEFANWVASTVGNGATASWVGGQLRVTTAPGTASELTSFDLSAVNAAGTSIANFNAMYSGTSTQAVAASNGGAVADTLTIANGSGSWNVAIAAGDDKQAIVNKINATSGIGVTAFLSGGEVELRSNAIGAASGFTVTSAGTLAGTLGFVETQAAQDAQFRVDGTMYSSATNMNVTGIIADVALNLLGVTSTTLTVAESTSGGTPATSPQDQMIASATAKIKAFADAYNAVQTYVHQKTQGESRVANPKSLQEYLQGPMSRDSRFSSVGYDMRRLMSDPVSGLPAGAASMLSQVGVDISFALGSTGTNGHLQIDDAKLDAALRADPAAVQAVFDSIDAATAGTGDGFARRISEHVSLLRVGGKVDTSMNGAGAEVRRLQDAIDRANDRLDRRRQYYERMFSSLETSMGRMQNQGAWLSGQLAGLTSQQQG